MKDFAQDGTNDLDINNNSGSITMVHERQELDQKIVNAVSTNTNELDWNQNIGLDQLDLIFNSNSQRIIESMLTAYLKRIFGDKQVISVTVHDLQYNDNTRTLTFQSNITLNIRGELLKLQPGFNLGGDDID